MNRGICRLGIPEVDELQNSQIRVPTVSGQPEGNTAARGKRECAAGSSEAQTPCMYRNLTHENREAPLFSIRCRTAAVWWEKAKSVRPI